MEGIKGKVGLTEIWLEMTTRGKQWPHLGALLWRRLLDVQFVYLSFSLLPCSYLWQQAPGRQTFSVCMCVCETVRIFGPFICKTGNCGQLESPCVSWIQGGKGNSQGWQVMEISCFFLFHFKLTWLFWSFRCLLTACSMEYVLLFSAGGHVGGRRSWVESGGKGEEKQPDSVKASSLFGPRASGCSPASLACLQQYLRPFFGRWE